MFRATTTLKLEEVHASLISASTKIMNGEAIMGQLIELKGSLAHLDSEKATVERYHRVLRNLSFDYISSRAESVKEAYKSTFEWMFDPSNCGFSDWLHYGSGIFWIRGKAGSGKSTLMKFLVDHRQTSSALRSWAGGRQLFIASHYFWLAGSPLQKSTEGLLRTLLYQILRESPVLIQELWSNRVFCDFASEREWSETELALALKTLSTTTLETSNFCFFIDGLDEYKGDQEALLQLLFTLTRSSFIKVCASSRPWNVFNCAFSGSDQKVNLEDLTRNDIWSYVHTSLITHKVFGLRKWPEDRVRGLADAVVNRADGVFLWVHLVVKRLLKGLVDGDGPEDTERVLKSIPDGLEKFYESILKNIEEEYVDDALQIIDITMHTLGIPRLAALFTVQKDAGRSDQGYRESQEPENQYTESKMELLSTRVNARCKDLLVVKSRDQGSNMPWPWDKIYVTFIHRTVYEFLRSTDAMEKLRTRAKSPFDPHITICRNNKALVMAILPEYVHALEFNQAARRLRINSSSVDQRYHDTGHFFDVKHTLFSVIDEIMHHVCQVERRSRASPEENQATLLEAHRILDEIIHHIRLEGPWHHPWYTIVENDACFLGGVSSKRHHSGDPEHTFLSQAIGRGMDLYVEARLTRVNIQAKKGWPMLKCALGVILHHRPDRDRPFPGTATVRNILHWGGDPNETFLIAKGMKTEPTSPWVDFLSSFLTLQYHGKEHERRRSRVLFETTCLLLDAGADPSVVVRLHRRPYTPIQLLALQLQPEDLATVERLIERKIRERTYAGMVWKGLTQSVSRLLPFYTPPDDG
ncbi:hypothetical protein F4780DRAFT_494425 [Xylariomycetidae sp. FL0641]|nr:hypothetical protein F4780DRAFT_494425 [Xylariomycetidae sp. FL0641]